MRDVRRARILKRVGQGTDKGPSRGFGKGEIIKGSVIKQGDYKGWFRAPRGWTVEPGYFRLLPERLRQS